MLNTINENKQVLEFYNNYEGLQAPEKTIFEIIIPNIHNMRVLDIGIGGGRTTKYFINAKEYVGIDYSPNMLELVNKKYSNKPNNLHFKLCNASDLSIFDNNYFDFVLFSFNGIDYITNPIMRKKVLKGIYRVLNKGGYFCFSSHNIQSTKTINQLKLSKKPGVMLINIIKYLLNYFYLRINNKNFNQMHRKKFAIIKDGCKSIKQNYYIKPIIQYNHLIDNGFKNVRFFSLKDGMEITNFDQLNNNNKDTWIYYLCNK